MSLIGLLSDSHGRDERTEEAAKLLVDKGADILIHLGDVATIEVIDALLVGFADGKPVPPVHLVFGNVDWDSTSMGRYAESLGITNAHPVGRLEIDGKQIIYQHGHEDVYMRQAMEAEPDYLFHGHTHLTRDEKVGSTRVINPGALFRAKDYTVALLDTQTDNLQFFTVV